MSKSERKYRRTFARSILERLEKTLGKVVSEGKRVYHFLGKTRRVRPYVRGELVIAFLSIALFWSGIFLLPQYVSLEVITPSLAAMLTVEGILVGFAPQFKDEDSRNMVGVTIGVPSLLITLTALVVSAFQSFQLKFLSTDTTTILFKMSAGFLGLLVEAYALSLILPGINRKVRNPKDTEP